MERGIGKVQEECLKTASEMKDIMKQILEMIRQENIDDIYEYFMMVSEFSRMLPSMLFIFEYESHIEPVDMMIRFCQTCYLREQLAERINELEIILKKLIIWIECFLVQKEGKYRTCICCEEKVFYKPLQGLRIQKERGYGIGEHTFETLNEEEYLCPCCQSTDRDRLLIAFLKYMEMEKAANYEVLLQIAPSPSIESWIYANCPSLKYHSTDLYMQNVTFSADIQNMASVEAEAYDYFICSHVLEHVQNDLKAMKELNRILKKDGIGLFLVPVFLDIDRIDEEWGLSEAENWKRFGQGDHCRSYERNGLIKRLEEAGFYVHRLGREFFGKELFQECGLTDTSALYVLTKQEGSIEELVESRKKKREEVVREQPLVSVIMPAYNHEQYVAEAIESVLNQTYRNFEFIVADDASTDKTVNEILKYEDEIDQIHLFDENTGCRMISFLQECAKGKYIAMMHSDDLWSEDKLKLQVECLESHPECAACFTGGRLFEEQEEKRKSPFIMMNKKKEGWFRYFFENGNCLCHPSVLIRREVYIELWQKGGAAMFRQVPDFWMWLKLVQENEIYLIEKELTFFRVHAKGKNRNTSLYTKESVSGRRQMVEEAYIWYDVIKKMDKDYFLNTFWDILLQKDNSSDLNIMCEKLFVLLKGRRECYKQAAIFYLFDIYQIPGIPEVLEGQYDFNNMDIYRLTGGQPVRESNE